MNLDQAFKDFEEEYDFDNNTLIDIKRYLKSKIEARIKELENIKSDLFIDTNIKPNRREVEIHLTEGRIAELTSILHDKSLEGKAKKEVSRNAKQMVK